MAMIEVNAEELAKHINESIRILRLTGCLNDSFLIAQTQSGIQVQVLVTRDDDEFMDGVVDGCAQITEPTRA